MTTLTPSRIGVGEYMSNQLVVRTSTGARVGGASLHRTDPQQRVIESVMGGLKIWEDTLLDWLRDPAALADDDVEVPACETIRRAIDFVQQLKSALTQPLEGQPLPMRGVSIGTGGAISIDFGVRDVVVTFEFYPDGSAERHDFRLDRLVRRTPIPF